MGRTKGKGHAWCERDRNGCCGGLEVCVLMHDQAVMIKQSLSSHCMMTAIGAMSTGYTATEGE